MCLDIVSTRKRSRLGLVSDTRGSRLGLVSDSLANVSVSSRSRELRSRSWSRSRQFRSRAQVPANHIFLVWKFELHHIETLFFLMKTQSSDQTFKMAAIRWRCVIKRLLKLATLNLHAYSQSQGHDQCSFFLHTSCHGHDSYVELNWNWYL